MIWWLLGCTSGIDTGPAPEPVWVQLFDPAAWTEVGNSSADPFPDRPDEFECSPLGYGLEGTYFEVSTIDCEYGTFQQGLTHGVPAGTLLKLVYWHLDLWAEEAAQGHLALQVNDTLLHEAYIDIPNGAEVYAFEFEAPAVMVEGDMVFFHIHNHGFNSWSLGGMEAFIVP